MLSKKGGFIMKNFAIIGVGGYIAPRHLKAIKETGNNLVAAIDKHDSVGIIDRYFPDADFFTEFERFDRHCEKLKRENSGKEIHFVSVCSPNYLHDAHIRFGLRIGANVICEKPIVLNPRNLRALQDLEREIGKKVYTVLQLRYHPSIIALRERIKKSSGKKHVINLTYITPRGKWYFHSWKAQEEKSGGVATNIGIHFFDMLIWIFGGVLKNEVYLKEDKRMSGYLELERASVKWYLSLDRNDLPQENLAENKPYRSISVDGNEIEFSTGFADLHTELYKQILSGNGFGLEDAFPSIQTVYEIRNKQVQKNPFQDRKHPFLMK